MVMERPWEELLAAMVGPRPFTYSRWGEDEWHCLFGERNGFLTPEGHVYFRQLCTDLSNVLLSRPSYRLGLGLLNERTTAYIDGCNLSDLAWCRYAEPGVSEVIHMLEAVTKTPIIAIGPPPLRKLRRLLGFAGYVEVPPKNAYLRLQDIVGNALALLAEAKRPSLVTVSASVCAPLVIHELSNRPESRRHRLVDVGGLWEQFVRK